MWNYDFCLADHDFTFDYQNARINSVSVKGANCWAFPQPGFDELIAEEAEKRSDLPTENDFTTDRCLLRYYADIIEYYWVVMAAPPANPE